METSPEIAAAVQAMHAAQRAISRPVHRHFTEDWIGLDLTMGQLKTLMTLAFEGALTVGGLAETLKVGKPSASILVDRLVQLGYVSRTEDSEDRRRTLVALTAAGDELAARLREGANDQLVKWLAAMRADDLDAFTRGMRALAAIAARDPAGEAECLPRAAPWGPR